MVNPLQQGRLCQVLLLLLLLHIDFGVVSVAGQSKWLPVRVNPASSTLSETYLNTNLAATGGLEVYLTNSDVNFTTALERDTTILPGACTSSSASNAFGWRRYAALLLPPGAVVVRPPEIVLRLQPLSGFSPTSTETVTCGIGTISTLTGKSYADGPISAADQYVSFTIESYAGVIAIRPAQDTAPQCAKPLAASPITEMMVRSGWGFALCITGDVWNSIVKNTIMRAFQCSSEDARACAWFLSALWNHSAIDAINEPDIIRVKIPYTVARAFNTNRSLVISFSPPIGTAVYGLKNSPTALSNSDRNFTVSAYKGSNANIVIRTFKRNSAFSETLPMGLTLETTEDCIRGFDSSLTCPPAFWLKITQFGRFFDEEGRLLQFGITDEIQATKDVNELAISSPTNGILSGLVKKLTTIATPSSMGPNANYDLFLNTTALFYYQIDQNESLTLALPFSVMASKESPINNVTILVRPSPGRLACPFPHGASITAKDIWNGGFTTNFTVGGEAWTPSTLLLFDTFVTGSPGGVWNQFRSCIFPNSSVAYGNNTEGSRGGLNHSVLSVQWNACPAYAFVTSTVPMVEVVTFNFSNSDALFSSKLPLAGTGRNCTVVIVSSPSTFAVQGLPPSINALVLMEGPLSLDFVLQGGSMFSNTDVVGCHRDFLAAMVPQAADPSGWSNSSVLLEMLPLTGLNQISPTVMRATFVPSRNYRTLRGDRVNFTALPGSCYGQVSTVFLPSAETFVLDVKPLRGVIAMSSNDSRINVRNLSASEMRVGAFEIIFRVVSDTFDVSNVTALAATILSSFSTFSLQPFGFDNLRTALLTLSPDDITAEEIRIKVQGSLAFAVSSPEFVSIDVDRRWMTSGVDPVQVGRFNTTINPSAGTVQVLRWFGDTTGGVVTELDVRNGLLWFEFVLIGDQWRQERDVYLSVFSGSQRRSATGFSALRQQLLPSIAFFQFTSSSDAAQSRILRLQFQATEMYDIVANELVTIAFTQETVSSRLEPTVQPFLSTDAANLCSDVQPRRIQLCVQAARGRAVASGYVEDLNEQALRRGAVEIYITLFGETWAASAPLCLRNRINTTNSNNALVFQSTILPLDGSAMRVVLPRVLLITLAGSTSYQLPSSTSDFIVVNVSAAGPCVASGLPLWPGVITVPIFSRTSELVLARMSPATVTEETMRQDQIVVQISLDGDAWNREYAQANILTLLQGFSSSKSPIEAPTGFSALSQKLLQTELGSIPDFSVTSQSLTVTLRPNRAYVIDETETVSFTLPSPAFILSNVMPNPSTVSFPILALPKVVVLKYLPVAGQFEDRPLMAAIAYALNMPSTAGISVNLTGRVGQSFIVYLSFLPNPSPFDSRTPVQLSALFMAMSPAFLSTHLEVSCAFLLGQSTLDAACVDLSTRAAATNTSATRDYSIELIVWGSGSAVFIGILAVITVQCVHRQQASLAGGVRKSHKATGSDKIHVVQDGEAQLEAQQKKYVRRPQSLRAYALGHDRMQERNALVHRSRGHDLPSEDLAEATAIPVSAVVGVRREDFRHAIRPPSLSRERSTRVDKGLSLAT